MGRHQLSQNLSHSLATVMCRRYRWSDRDYRSYLEESDTERCYGRFSFLVVTEILEFVFLCKSKHFIASLSDCFQRCKIFDGRHVGG